jgi:transposase-like protein
MPWREVSVMDQRREFVRLAMQEGVNRRELCRRFGISPDIGYKWLARQQAGDAELADRSRRPHGSPRRAPRHTTQGPRWPLRNLLRQPAGRHYRLDRRQKCQ